MRRLLLPLAAPFVVVAVLALSACSEQLDATVDDLAGKALDAGIRDQLDGLGIELDGDPSCTTDFTRDGAQVTGGADCTAETTSGDGVDASFSGSLSPSGCDGTLTITVAGEQVADLAEIPDCSVDFGF